MTVTPEEAREIWLKGFNSAASLCEKEIRILLDRAHYQAHNAIYAIPSEAISAVKEHVANGLYKEMRIADKAGLDYYFAQTDPASITRNQS